MNIQAFAALAKAKPLEPYNYQTASIQGHDCLIKVLACGLCHSDLHMIDNDWQMSRYPLVPGHEVVGEVVEAGPAVSHLRPGDRVGVGWQRTACLQCGPCLEGNENLCEHNEGLIVSGYGGFADYLVVDSRFAFPLTSGLETETCGPLLCGGVTVYSGLIHAGMKSGQNIGIIGVGGLGHLAVQFAARLGNKVTVFTTSPDKAEYAGRLGADEAVVVPPGTRPPEPKRKLNILLNTVPVSMDWNAYLNHLKPDGTLCFVAIPPKPLNLMAGAMLGQRLRVMASPIGGRAIMHQMLETADRFGIAPQVEFFPLKQVNKALDRVRLNQVRYRAVLLNKQIEEKNVS